MVCELYLNNLFKQKAVRKGVGYFRPQNEKEKVGKQLALKDCQRDFKNSPNVLQKGFGGYNAGRRVMRGTICLPPASYV